MLEIDLDKESIKEDPSFRSLSTAWKGFGVANSALHRALNPDPKGKALNPDGVGVSDARIRAAVVQDTLIGALSSASQEIVDRVIPAVHKPSLSDYLKPYLPEAVLAKLRPAEPSFQ